MVCLCSIPEIASEDFLNGIKDPIYEVAKNKTKKKNAYNTLRDKMQCIKFAFKGSLFSCIDDIFEAVVKYLPCLQFFEVLRNSALLL